MQQEFIRLEETLRAICGRGPVYYLPNSGNLGDALIRFGTRKFLRDVGIDCTELSPGSSVGPLAQLRGGTVIYGGGGAWCSLWGGAERKVARFNRRFHVVVLPSTYEQRYVLGNTTFFRRDEFESREHMPDAVFCHDLAFYIGPLSAPCVVWDGPFLQDRRGKLREVRTSARQCRPEPSGPADVGRLPIHRRDREARGGPHRPAARRDRRLPAREGAAPVRRVVFQEPGRLPVEHAGPLRQRALPRRAARR